jgi:hypothetical protein
MRAVASGALLGLSFTAAEVVTGYWSGGQFPVQWWAFLAIYYVPALAVTTGALAAALRAARRPAPESTSLSVSLRVLLATYLTVVLIDMGLFRPRNQPVAALLSAALAVSAFAVVGCLSKALQAGERPLPNLALYLVPFALPLSVCVATTHIVAHWPTGAALAIVITVAGAVEVWWSVLRRTFGRGRTRFARAIPFVMLSALIAAAAARAPRTEPTHVSRLLHVGDPATCQAEARRDRTLC